MLIVNCVSFLWVTAFIHLLQLSASHTHVSWSNAAYFSWANLSSSSRYHGLLAWTLVFSSPYKFSVGIKSGRKGFVLLEVVLDQEQHMFESVASFVSSDKRTRFSPGCPQYTAEVTFFLGLQPCSPVLCRPLVSWQLFWGLKTHLLHRL